VRLQPVGHNYPIDAFSQKYDGGAVGSRHERLNSNTAVTNWYWRVTKPTRSAESDLLVI